MGEIYYEESFDYKWKSCVDRAKSILTKYNNTFSIEDINDLAKDILNQEYNLEFVS